MALCHAQNTSGKPCRSAAVSDSEYCFFHNPKMKKQRREAQRKGGARAGKLHVMPPPPPSEFDLADVAQIPKLLNYVTNRILRGELDPKFSYAITQLCDCALRAHNAVEVKRTVDQIQRIANIENDSPFEPATELFLDTEPDHDDRASGKSDDSFKPRS